MRLTWSQSLFDYSRSPPPPAPTPVMEASVSLFSLAPQPTRPFCIFFFARSPSLAPPPGGGTPYKGLIGTCGQSGYVLGFLSSERVSIFITVLNRVSFLGKFSSKGYSLGLNFLRRISLEIECDVKWFKGGIKERKLLFEAPPDS